MSDERHPPAVRAEPPMASGALPRIGHLLAWRRDPLGLISRAHAEHGDAVALSFRGATSVLLGHPDDAGRVLQQTGRAFAKASGGYVFPRAFGTGLLTSTGELWRRQRGLAQPAFHRRRVAGHAETMVGLAEQAAAGWRAGRVVDVSAQMSRLTQRIAGVTLFGLDTGAHAERAAAALGAVNRACNVEATSLLIERLPASVRTPNRRRADAAIAELDALVAHLLAGRAAAVGSPGAGGSSGDLLGRLAGARDADGTGMSDRQLRDEVVTLYLAGHETTANTLAFAIDLLARHPEAAARLRAEVAEVVGDRAPEAGDLAELRYTRAVVEETMRLFPPIWQIFRIATTDAEFQGRTVRAGTGLMLSPWLTQRDPRWFAEPDRFRPARWLDGSAAAAPRFAHAPFGGGPRVCLGSAFAEMEAVLVLAVVAGRVGLVPVDPRVPLAPLITLRPRRAIRVRVTEPPRAG